MDKSSADVFVYAKASGMLAKSFVGSRVNKLFSVNTIEGLWELLFQSSAPSVSESSLVQMIEEKAEQEFLCGFISLLKEYSRPQTFLVELLRFYDYDNLKNMMPTLVAMGVQGSLSLPARLASIGKFSLLKYDKWPSLDAMTAGSPVAWCADAQGVERQCDIDGRLDAQYVRTLWNSVAKLDSTSKEPVRRLLKDEIIYHNIIWALRLRIYYGMEPSDILCRLVTSRECRSNEAVAKDELAKSAAQILMLPLDSYREWVNWKYSYLLNPCKDGGQWSLDLRWVQRMARFELSRRALHQFHHHPFTSHVLFCWFKVKQYELDCIRMVAEGIRFKVSPAQIKEFSGIRAC